MFLYNNSIYYNKPICNMEKCTNFCRACLKEADDYSHFIYGDISPMQYIYCTSIQVNREDELTKAICDNCYKVIIDFIEFKSRCIKSEIQLLKISEGVLPGTEQKGIVKEIKPTNEDLAARKHIKRENERTEACLEFETELKYNIEVEVEELNDSHCDVTDLQTDILEYPTKKEVKVETTKSSKKRIQVSDTKSNIHCEQCTEICLSKKQLENHTLLHHNSNVEIASLQCKICNQTFMTKWGLLCHIKIKHIRCSFKDATCQICHKVLSTPNVLKKHMKTHEHTPGVVCDQCGKVLKNDTVLRNHLKTHINNREFTCEHCGKKYTNKKRWTDHVNRRHSNKRYICDYCNYGFKEKASLKTHIMQHEGRQAKFQCDICFKFLTTKPSLKFHKRTHTGEKPFSCKYCSKSFSLQQWLTAHERVHTGEKPFECTVCALKFARRSSMKRHMKVHNVVGCKQRCRNWP